MQAEAKAQKDRQDQLYLRNAYNQGLTNQPFSFEGATKTAKVDGATFVGAGVSDPTTETELQKKARKLYVNGAINRLLNDKNVAPYAQQIEQYLSSGGQFYLMKNLPPAARMALREIKNMSGASDPFEYQELAEQSKAEFAVAAESGSFLIQEAKNKTKIAEAQQAAFQEQQDAQADNFLLNAEQSLLDNNFNVMGRMASITQIDELIEDINARSNAILALDVSAERKKKVIKALDSMQDQLAEGIIERTLALKPEKAEELSAALGSGDMSTLVEIIPSLQFKRFVELYDKSDNGPKLSSMAEKWSKGVKIKHDEAKDNQVINLELANRDFKLLKASGNLSEMTDFYNTFKSSAGAYSKTKKSYISALSEMETAINSQIEEQNKSTFKAIQRDLETGTDSDNVQGNIERLFTEGKRLGADQEDVASTLKTMVQNAALDSLSDYLAGYGTATEASATELKLMSVYARDRNLKPEGLTQDMMAAVDQVLDAEFFAGGDAVTRVDPEFISQELNKRSEGIFEAIKKNNTRKANDQYEFNVVNKLPLPNATTVDGQTRYGRAVANQAGLSELPRDLFTKPINELTDNEAYALSMMKGGGAASRLFVTETDRFLAGVMSETEVREFMRNARELALTDSSGRIGFSSGAMMSMGEKRATQLRVMFEAYKIAPRGSEAAFLENVSKRIASPFTPEAFKELTSYSNQANLILAADVPPNMIDAFTPIVDAMAVMYGKKAEDTLANLVEERFFDNPNAYSPVTSMSKVEFDIGSLVSSERGFEEAIREKVAELSTEDERLFFNVGSGVSIDDLREAIAGVNLIEFPTTREELTMLSLGKRVFYGPTAQFTHDFPVMQLYKLDENGLVSVIDGSAFNARTDPLVLKYLEKYARSTDIKTDLEMAEEYSRMVNPQLNVGN
jgi:hypothetical protein